MSSLSPGISDMVVSFDEELNRYRFRGLQVLVGLTVPLSTLRR
jgi:hypothetical protein